MMMTLISIELYKIFKKWRTYISFIAIAVIVGLIHLAFYLTQGNSNAYLPRTLQDTFVTSGNLLNGYFISYLILQSLFVHVPFLVVLVGGDLMAGEATSGTYRMLVTRPVSRLQIVSSKFIAGNIATIFLLLFLALLSLGVGTILFGTGALLVMKGKMIIFASHDVLWRYVYAYGFAVLSMSVVVSLAFLFSSFVENAVGPIVATMAVLIIFLILSVLQFDIFASVQPFLFTNYMNGWLGFFSDPVDFKGLFSDAMVLLAHIVGFYVLALFIFYRKDILS